MLIMFFSTNPHWLAWDKLFHIYENKQSWSQSDRRNFVLICLTSCGKFYEILFFFQSKSSVMTSHLYSLVKLEGPLLLLFVYLKLTLQQLCVTKSQLMPTSHKTRYKFSYKIIWNFTVFLSLYVVSTGKKINSLEQ